MRRHTGILLLLHFIGLTAAAQDTLPRFTVVNKGGNRIIISWTNPYDKGIHQLSIQRSLDSTKNFKSILTLPDPTVPQNGYADTKAMNDHMFYRLYILLDSGNYIFSKSKKPVVDTARITEGAKNTRIAESPLPETSKPDTKTALAEDIKSRDAEKKETAKAGSSKPKEIAERIIYIKKRDTLIGQIGERSLRRFRDSVAVRTKDTLSFNTADTIVIRNFIPREVYRPSKFVFTERDGNIKIDLPLSADKKYTIRFFDESNTPVFEIKQIKDPVLTLDKANFMHAGWFQFELYEDGMLKEKHKLFIAKEF